MKKTWSKPELYIISQDPLQAKNIPNVREVTGHYLTLPSIGYKGFANTKGTTVVSISSNSVPHRHKSDFIS
jgi:hypothetical protein